MRLIRDGEKGGGEREIIYLSLHCHHQNDSCIKMGSDESHFNISVGSDGQSHRTVSTNYNHNTTEKYHGPTYRSMKIPYAVQSQPLTLSTDTPWMVSSLL